MVNDCVLGFLVMKHDFSRFGSSAFHQAIMLLSLCAVFLNTVVLAMEPDLRIVNGHTTQIIKRPFQVLVRINFTTDPEILERTILRCGGSIIGKRSILTAAHCVKNDAVEDILINVGLNNLRDDLEPSHAVKTVVIHPEYGKDPSGWGSDIAILTTSADIEYSATVKPIKLSKNSPLPTTRAIVSGYGKIRERGNDSFSPSQSLKQATVTIFSQELCKRILWWKNTTIDKTQFCAMDPEEHSDACGGDSGGPLTIGNRLVGIVSWGVGCGRADSPGVYTDVYQFLDWIKQNISDPPLSGYRQAVPITVRPFHVSLYFQSRTGMPWCGGSIISKRSVLTAAHCLRNKTAQDILIRVGSQNLQVQSEDGHWYTVMKYIIHENFNTHPWSNDIAVVITVADFNFETSVQPIPLSTESPADAKIVYVSAYFSSQSGISEQANILMVQDLQKWNHSFCQQLLTQMTTTRFPVITSRQFCAIDPAPEQDGCILDDGAPITTEMTGGHLAGIASFEQGCDKRRAFTLHTDVASFADWIVASIQEFV